MSGSDLAAAIRAGDRTALARAITQAESTRADHRAAADALLGELLPHTGTAMRIGVSGAPGAGKSTFIESLGVALVEAGHRVAVLAVDPTSTRTGGSILGDKTRMEELARSEAAFIRPSPSGGSLGGVARRTREAILLCEAAAYDIVLVETVGVGQSEVAVASMVDMFILVVAPAAGDELQGIKRGIVELADLVAVNKHDGDLAGPAGLAAREYSSALRLLRRRTPEWEPRVLAISALERRGIAELWSAVEAFRDTVTASGSRDSRRQLQAQDWLWSEVFDGLTEEFRADDATRALVEQVETDVRSGALAPTVGAHRLLDTFLRRSS